MNAEEAFKLCRLAKAASPAQAIDDYTPELWALSLTRERFVDAQQALIELAREQEWIHLSHIVARIKKIRSDRVLNHGPQPDPPAGLTDSEEWEWLCDMRKRIADGEVVEWPALPAPDPGHAQRVKALLRGAFHGTEEA